MFIPSQQIINKRDAVLRLANQLGVDGVIKAYPKKASASQLTHKIALEAIKLDLTSETVAFLEANCNIPFAKDNRSSSEYGLSLIYGWFIEDIIVKWLEDNRFTVNKIGADSQRVFLKARNITTDLDIEVTNTITGKTEKFDIYNDSRDYWVKNDKMDVRENKWNALVNHSAAMLCISSAGFAIIDTTMPHKMAQNPLWGGKMAATIQGVKKHLKTPQEALQSLSDRLS
jgi:hypothetical protein